jgi:hypothetical protein
MSDLRRAIRAARPVVAGQALSFRKRGAVELRAGHQVVFVRRIAAAVHDLAFFGDRVFLAQLVVVAVEIGDAVGDLHALRVEPRAGADAVFGVDAGLAGRRRGAEIRAPRAAARAGGGRERLAILVGAFKPAEIGALTRIGARDEEAQLRFVLRDEQG